MVDEAYAITHDVALNKLKGFLEEHFNKNGTATLHAVADLMVVAVTAMQGNDPRRASFALSMWHDYMQGSIPKLATHMAQFTQATDKMEHRNVQ